MKRFAFLLTSCLFLFLFFQSAHAAAVSDEELLMDQKTAVLVLNSGWNLVSSPAGSSLPVDDLVKTCGITEPIWHWNNWLDDKDNKWERSGEEYMGHAEIKDLQNGRGYWVYSDRPCNLFFDGPPKLEFAAIVLVEGWNMFSWPLDQPMFVEDIKRQCKNDDFSENPFWTWDSSLPDTAPTKWRNSAGDYEGNPVITILESGVGYYKLVKGPSACAFEAPLPEVSSGVVEKSSFKSKVFNEQRKYNVYLPPSYFKDFGKKFPVLYFFHGAAGNEDDALKIMKLPNAMDKLIRTGKIKHEFIVVMPDMDSSAGENGCSGLSFKGNPVTGLQREGSCGNYEDYIVKELIPAVESKYRAVKNKMGRATGGYSNGAHSALWIASRHPDMFVSAFGTSGLYDTQTDRANIGTYSIIDASKLKTVKVYIDTGVVDISWKDNKRFAKKLKENNVDYIFKARWFRSHVSSSWISSMFTELPLTSLVMLNPKTQIRDSEYA